MYAFCDGVGDLASCEMKARAAGKESFFGEEIESSLEVFRVNVAENVRRHLPSPHSELLLGMVIGVDNLNKVPRFNDMLRETGTIHVVVVSGFNISLVFGLVLAVIGTRYKTRNLIVAQAFTSLYAIISGFEPPVVRSLIMGSIAAWGKYYGRSLDAERLLIFSGLLMVAIRPKYLFSLSFQLSFLATLSLVLFSSTFSAWLKGIFGVNNVVLEDLSTTLAAQVLVWPLISYRFGTASLISPLVNALILWTVPLATVIGGLLVSLVFVSPFLASIVAFVVYFPLDVFVWVVETFSTLKYASIPFQVSAKGLIIYYALILVLHRIIKFKGASCS